MTDRNAGSATDELLRLATLPAATRRAWSPNSVEQFTDAVAKLLSQSAVTGSVTEQMVNRFLNWPLPASVCSDPCASTPNYPHQRVGTNLLTADEARQMLEHVVGPVLGAKQAVIDRLMLEHCPEDMTEEQVREWGEHQKPAGPEAETAIEYASHSPLTDTSNAAPQVPQGSVGGESRHEENRPQPAVAAPISTVPCPFCGSTFAAKVEVKDGFRLRCVMCDAQTGVATEDSILKGYWERRSTPSATGLNPEACKALVRDMKKDEG